MQSASQSKTFFGRIGNAIASLISWIITIVMFLIGIAVLLGCLVLLMGCANKDIVLADPDAPLFISDTSMTQYRVSAWDADEHALKDLGWRPISSLRGRTVTSFDWAQYAEEDR